MAIPLIFQALMGGANLGQNIIGGGSAGFAGGFGYGFGLRYAFERAFEVFKGSNYDVQKVLQTIFRDVSTLFTGGDQASPVGGGSAGFNFPIQNLLGGKESSNVSELPTSKGGSVLGGLGHLEDQARRDAKYIVNTDGSIDDRELNLRPNIAKLQEPQHQPAQGTTVPVAAAGPIASELEKSGYRVGYNSDSLPAVVDYVNKHLIQNNTGNYKYFTILKIQRRNGTFRYVLYRM